MREAVASLQGKRCSGCAGRESWEEMGGAHSSTGRYGNETWYGVKGEIVEERELARVGSAFLHFGFNVWTDKRANIGLMEKVMNLDMYKNLGSFLVSEFVDA